MSTVGLSNCLAEWMNARGATEIRVALDEDADGGPKWCAAIVHDNHQPGCRHKLTVLDTSEAHSTVWGAIGELAYERQPVRDLDSQDWGRLGDRLR